MKTNSPKVSVIMPIYNAEEYVKETIEGILGQSFSDFELLLIDDKPTDNTMSIVSSIDDDRIRIIHNEHNMGISQSRNNGIRNARGEYIALMDDDDLTVVDRFAKEVKYLDEHPEIGVVGGNVVTIDSANNVISPTAHMINNPDYLWLDIVFQCPMANSSTMFRRELVEKHNLEFKDNMLGMEDYRFWMEFSGSASIYNFNDVFLKWRTRAGAETTRVRSKMKDERAVKFSEIQRIGLEQRGCMLTEDEWNTFFIAFSEYKDLKSYDVVELRTIIEKIKNQLIDQNPEKKDCIISVLRNRFLEAARRVNITSMQALGPNGLWECDIEEKPLVSVVIPTHNRSDKLPISVRSVLNQNYKNLEVIISDDGSTDSTPEVAGKLALEYSNVRYYRSDSNKGPSHARNYGVSMAKGEFVAFHDDDDEWHPDKLSIQMQQLLDHPDVDMSFAQMCRYRSKAFLNIVDEFLDWENIKDDFFGAELLDNYVGAPTIVMRKSFFETIGGFSEDISTIEDWEFAIRASKNGKVGFVKTPLMDVHVGDGSVTHNHVNYYKSWCYIVQHYIEDAADRNLFLQQMFRHLQGNTHLMTDESKCEMRAYLSEMLVPNYIREELLLEYALNSATRVASVNENIFSMDRLQRYKNVSQLLMNVDGIIPDWLVQQGYSTVGIYGVGRLGKCLYERLSGSGAIVKVLIDREASEYQGMKVFTQEEFKKSGITVDAIIITPLYEAEGIALELSETGIECISIENLCK